MMICSAIFLFVSIISYLISMGIFISAYRKLADYQYQNYHVNWVNDGRPRGGKITRNEITFISSDIAANFCILSWLFKRPVWVVKGSEGSLFRARMIRWAFISLIAFLAVGSGFFWFGYYLLSTSG